MEKRPWCSHYPQEVPQTIDYPDHVLTDWLLQAANEYPEHTAIQFLGRSIPYQELLSHVYRLAHLWQKLGVKQGDRIGIMLPNTPQAVIGYFATLLLGAIVVQINPLYQEKELAHQLSDSGTEILLCLDLIYPRVKKVLPKTHLKTLLITSLKDYLPPLKSWLYPFMQKQPKIDYDESTLLLAKELEQVRDTPIQSPLPSNDSLAILQYTGGTTGLSKGAMLTHRNLVVNVRQIHAWCYRFQRGDIRILGVMPFFHVYGMTTVMNFAIYLAGTMILVPKFEPLQLLRAIHRYHPNVFPGAPTIYASLLRHPQVNKYDLSSIQACISGSAPLDRELQDQFEALTGGILTEGYGLTEASPVTHINLIWDRKRSHTIGLPLPDTDCRVVDPETGTELMPGQQGELHVKGPQVMKGYWNQPGETKSALRDGWLATGDIVKMDESGYFEVVDRKKDMIITNGYNVFPREVEEVLLQHEAVEEAAVIGVPDLKRGELIRAVVVPVQGKAIAEKDLEHFCRQHLAAYKIPRQIEFRSQLPKSAIGKVLRRVMKEEALRTIEPK
ncbi:long-chain-fatty-acid--CoA ligase [Seinonella peptonophila]|uniref:long-chain-fatty-acid--CoA ligase n=1 Tax=Seinonella peptonophila TaxID=112248 RepID=UPI000932D669|nr:long-chain fatty acid--CoA ligase [Seinonella peptonophila]